MIKLINNKPVRYNGIHYDFTGLDEHKLQNIYDNHPLLRHLFEIIEDKLDDFLTNNKPEGKTEEEFFNDTIEDMKKPIRKRIKRK